MDELLSLPTVEGHDDPWKNVLEKLAGREMPPDDEEERPAHDEYEKQIAWLRGELEKSEQATAAARPRTQRRLKRAEYNRTVSDLFGWPFRVADTFPPDDARHGFTVVAETAILFIPGWLRMLDLACHSWCRPLAAVTGALVRPFVFLDRHVPAVRRHGYLLATVVMKPDRGG